MQLSLRQKHSGADFSLGGMGGLSIDPDGNLLDMPNEILCSVIDHVNPGDLEHFAEASPILESLAANALKVHRGRAQEYTKIVLDGCDYHGGCHPVHLLEQICAKPRLAWYPTSLRVACCGADLEEHADEEFAPLVDDEEFDKNMAAGFYDGRDNWETDALNVYKVMKVWSKDIKERIFRSGYFDEEFSERLYNQIRKGNRQGILGLLLVLLPNLEFIGLRGGYSGLATFFGEIVKRITGDSSGKDRSSAQVLTKLHELGLYGDGQGRTSEDFNLVGSFARLPSMKKVHVVAAASPQVLPSNNTWAQMESQSSNIDEIRVERGEGMDEESVMHCLRSLKTLRKFHYDWRGGLWAVNTPHIDLNFDQVSRMLAAVAAHFQSSLEDLRLKCRPLESTSHMDILLNCFEKLTKASLPIQLFAPAPKTQPESTPDKATTLSIGDGDEPQPPNLAKFPRLVDILPRSMEVVKFKGTIEIQAVETMLEGLVEHREDRLPRLKKIVFQIVARVGAPDTAAVLQERCGGVGIQLVLGEYRMPTMAD